jgi:hypothetical protein
MNDEYIGKDLLQNYCIYYCNARNFRFGMWYEGKMYGIRRKFGDEYIDTEFHYDDGADKYGTCKPFIQLTTSLENRLHPSFFDCRNWRGQSVIHDILSSFDALMPEKLDKLSKMIKEEY